MCLSYLLKITAGGRQFRIYYTQTNSTEKSFSLFSYCVPFSYLIFYVLAVTMLLTIFGHLNSVARICVCVCSLPLQCFACHCQRFHSFFCVCVCMTRLLWLRVSCLQNAKPLLDSYRWIIFRSAVLLTNFFYYCIIMHFMRTLCRR